MFISQLTRNAWACSAYECFVLRALRLSNKLLLLCQWTFEIVFKFGKSIVNTGIFSNNMWSPPSGLLHVILEDNRMQWHPPVIRHYINLWPCYRTRPSLTFYPIAGGFHNNCNGCDMPTAGAYSYKQMALFSLEHVCSNVETNLSHICLVSWLWDSSLPLYFYLIQVTLLFWHLFLAF